MVKSGSNFEDAVQWKAGTYTHGFIGESPTESQSAEVPVQREDNQEDNVKFSNYFLRRKYWEQSWELADRHFYANNSLLFSTRWYAVRVKC